MSHRVNVLVLNWNNWKDTNECLVSLQSLDFDNWKLIVLDNGSTDGSVLRIRTRFPDVEVVELGENFGFARGNNAGIRVALERGAEYVWLLNNDTTVDSNALRALVEKADQDPKIGAVGSAIYSMDQPEHLQLWGGGRVSWLGRSHYFSGPVSDEEVQFLTGASLFLRCSTIRGLGLLDEGFFMYWEDADYCFRMRRAGWKLAVSGDSRVWHKEQGTVGKKSERLDFQFSKSAVRFYRRNSYVPLLPIVISIFLRIAKRAIAGDWKRAQAVWAGASAGST
jgi:GT2 family glycosyltransferase